MAEFGQLTDVTLDFRGIATVGPSFTDELFRVFQAAHPEVTLRWTGAEPYVAGMIRKALQALAEQSPHSMQGLPRRGQPGPER